MGDGDENTKPTLEDFKKAKELMEFEAKWQDLKLQYMPPKIRVPKSKRWDNCKIIERGFGPVPDRIRFRSLLAGENWDYDSANDEWCWYTYANRGTPNKPNNEDKEKLEALQVTVNLLKQENVMLHKILERLTQRMDRLEFNAELGDDYDERERSTGGNEETPAAASGGTRDAGPEGESIPIGDAA